jgi:phospho-N-acetylmuramoyl-pentapeptide-transferase
MVYALVVACAALVLAIMIGAPAVSYLRAKKLGKSYTGDEPEVYEKKAGTPTMGGVIFLTAITAVALPTSVVRDTDILLPLLAMLVAGALGSIDDLQTLVGRQKLSGHETWFWLAKWLVLVGLGIAVALILYFQLDLKSVAVPHFGVYRLGALYLPLAVVIFVVGTSGAVITDGMDGLMAGVSVFAYAAYAIIALAQGQDELGAFALTVVAATAAFLWYNANPAQVIMGEVGAQSLAVGLIVVAFMTGWWLLLPVIGVIFVAEGLSDVIQIGYFKATKGKRFFRMAPIHYHFQLGGWAETQVVARFWLVGLLGAMAGVALALTD